MKRIVALALCALFTLGTAAGCKTDAKTGDKTDSATDKTESAKT